MITTLTLLSLASAATAPQIDERLRGLTARVDAARIEHTVRDLVGFGTRHVLSSTEDPSHGTGAARDYLEARLRAIADESDGRLEVSRFEATVAATRLRRTDLPIVNLVATLRGTTDPERVYVVGGHYDSRNGAGGDGDGAAPGANDDGSGTAVAIEACRVLAGESFAATITFVCYDGEEQGLLGSTAHARALAEGAAVIDGMITNDIVGNTLGMDGVRRDGYLRCFSYAPRGNDSVGRSLARCAHRAARVVEGLDIKLVLRGDRYGRGGDHRPFAQQGYPAIRLTEPREDYSRQHQNVTERDGAPYADLPEFMDFEYATRVARLNVALLAELAAAPRAPRRVRVRGARTSYATSVSWTANEDPAGGFEVVWRDTTSALWESAQVVGAAAREATLEGVCLDDVVVGVRAFGADGARSRIATPPEPDALGNRPRERRNR